MLSLGDINFGLGIDTSGLGQSVRQVQNFGRQVESAAASSAAGASRIEAALRRQEAATLRALQATLRFNQESRRMGVPPQMINASNAAFATLSQRMTQGAVSTLHYQRSMEQFQARMGRLKRELTTFDPTPNGAKMRVWLQDMTSSATLALGPLSGVGSRITALSSIISRSSVIAAAFFASITAGAYAFYKLGQAAVETSLQFDRIRARLDGLSRSSQESSADFARLKEIAQQTGVNFGILAEQWSFVKAAAKDTTLEGDKAFDMFRNLAVAAAKFQLSNVAVEASFKAISQMMSKGTVQLEELKGQLGDQLPIAIQAAAQAMGVGTRELFKMIKAGDVATEDFLIPFTQAIAKILGVDVLAKIDNLTASMGRFKNSLLFFNDAMNQSVGYSKAFKAAIEGATGVVEYLTNNIENMQYYLALAGVAMLGFIAPSVITGMLSLARAITMAALAMAGFNTAANAMPMLRLVSVIAAVTAAMYAMRGSFNAVADATNNSLSTSVDEYIKLQEGMKAASRNTTKQLISDVQKQIAAIQIQINATMTARATLNSGVGGDPAFGGKTFGQHAADKSKGLLSQAMKAFGFDASGTDELLDQMLPSISQQTDKATRDLADLGNSMSTYEGQLLKLLEISKKPEFGDIAPKVKPETEEGLSRSTKAIRDARQEIERMQATMEAAADGPQWFSQFEKQEEVNKKIQDFRDRLVDAKVPLGEVNALALQYATTLKLMQEQMEGPFAGMQQMFETFQNTAVEAFRAVTDEIGRAVVDGKINAEMFIGIVKSMVAKIISEILTLAVVNPLLNGIFNTGTQKPTLGGGGFLNTIGSFIGGMFGGGKSIYGKGGAFSGGVEFMRAGGLLKGATAFQTGSGVAIGGEAGNEALMPLTRTKNGDLGVRVQGADSSNAPIINIMNATGQAVTTRTRKSGGASITDIVIGEVGQGFAKGRFDSAMQGRYQRRPGRSGRE